MGEGGTLLFVNGTDYDWHCTYAHSYQMNSWPFNDKLVIAAHTSVKFYIEWDDNIFHDKKDDGGNATFSLAGTPYSFDLGTGNRYLAITLKSIATINNAQGSTLNLGWKHDGVMPFVISGKEGSFASTNPPAAWMQANLGSLGSRILRHICIPGSHDAGMYKITGGTAFANAANTQTQTKSIGDQLKLGSRYFDCRPVISSGKYTSGHYSNLPSPLGWQGGNGESFEEIIREINDFTTANKELIILNLSHDRNTDTGRDYRAFNQAEWNALFQQLMGITSLFVAPNSRTVDLTELPLSQFIGSNRAAVVIIAQPDDGSVTLGDYADHGFYTYSQFDAYNSYADTQDLNTMSNDQLQKLRKQRTSPDDQEFLLSWTLTQGTEAAVSGSPTILDLANTAQPKLYTDVYPVITRNTYPNILFLDGWNSSDPTALAMAINDTVA